MRSPQAAAALLALAGCTRPATEVLVHLQSDIALEELDGYRIRVDSAAADEERTIERGSTPGTDFPSSFSLTPKDEGLARRVTVAVEGLLGERSVVTATRAFDGFIAGETRHLCIFLDHRCAVSVPCPDGQSCGRNGCESVLAEPASAPDPLCTDLPPPPPMNWWDSAWRFRMDVTLGAGAKARADHAVALEIDFGRLLEGVAPVEDFDPNSPRVIEHRFGSGEVIGEVASSFHRDAGTARGLLVFLLEGETPADAQRTYGIYFDAASRHRPPDYWTATATESISNGTIQLQHVGYHHSGTRSAFAFSGTDLAPRVASDQNVFSRGTKIRSLSARIPPTATTDRLANMEAGGVAFSPCQPFSVFHEPKLRIVECVVVLPQLRIRELILVGAGPWAQFLTRFENIGPDPLDDLIYADAMDFDLGADHTNDAAIFDQGVQSFLMHETADGEVQHVVAFSAFDGVRAYDVANAINLFNTVVPQNMFGNNTAAGPADLAAAFELPVAPIAPGGVASVRTALVSLPTQALAREQLETLREPLLQTRSGLIVLDD